jgi:hypothetical protein
VVPAQISRIWVAEGLHAAAEANGGTLVIDSNPAPRNIPRTLEDMIGRNTAVVTGIVQSVTTKVNKVNKNDVESIKTLYEIAVTEVLQGTPPASLILMVEGGRFTYPDGVVAEIRTGAEPLVPGDSYILFVSEKESDVVAEIQGQLRRVHGLVAGLDSVYHVSSGRVRSLTPRPTELSERYNQRTLQSYLNDVRAAIAAAESRGR